MTAVVAVGLAAGLFVASRTGEAAPPSTVASPAAPPTTTTSPAVAPEAAAPTTSSSTRTTSTTTTTTTPTSATTVVTSLGGYTYVPKPDSGPGAVAPGGALTKHLIGDIGAAFGFPVGDVEAAIAAAALPPEAGGNPEGWLAPGAYEEEGTALELVQAMVDRRIAQLEERRIPRDQWHRVVTAASVIEKETYNQNEKPNVARVLTNRLAGGGPLQMDSIILYPVPEDRIFTTSDERSANQPYNSYRFDGLPPTPICSPDEASIDAFLDPPPGDWFFYVTVDLVTGDTRYAVTYDEHLTNVELLRAWLRDNPTP